MFQGKMKVLLLEDNPVDVLLIEEMFTEEATSRFELASVARLADGIKRLSEQEFDAVLLDLNLPDSIGIATARSLKQNAPNLPIVILTALADESIALEALRIGMEDYLVKGQITATLLAHSLRYAVERKHVEEALRESEEKYSTLVEKATDGVAIIQDNVVKFANRRMAEISGYTGEELTGMSTFDLVPSDFAPVLAERFAQRAQGADVSEVYQTKLLCKDGTVKEMESSTKLIQYKGRPATIAIIRDISERKHMEAEIVALSNAFRATLDAVLILDMAGNVKNINEAARRLFETEELGVNALEYVVPEDKEGVAAAMQELILKGRSSVAQFNIVTRSGRRVPIEASGNLMLDASGKPVGIVIVERELTERKQAEGRQKLAAEILGILNEALALPDAINRILAAIKRETGFSAVGIRLRKDDDFPYFVQRGFSEDFLFTENTLAVRGRDGGICRDEKGNISLECTCGLVLSGKTDPSNPLFTSNGSAWTNDSIPLLDFPLEQDPRLHPRNRCIHAGFQSVALMPIRRGNEIVGLLQLNDRRKGCFTPEMIRFFEGIAASIGVALMRKRTEEALRESEEKFRSLVENASEIIFSLDTEGKITYLSPSVEASIGYKPAELIGKYFEELVVPEDLKYIADRFRRRLGGGLGRAEFRVRAKSGALCVIQTSSSLIRQNGKVIGLTGVGADVTERNKAEAKIQHHAKRIEALYAIAQVISQASTIDAMLGEALDKVCDVMDMEAGGIFMLDYDDRALKLKACKGVPENTMQKFLTIAMTELGMEGLVNLTGPMTEIDETQDVIETEKMKEVIADIGRKGLAAVPFFKGKDLQGLIVIFTTEDRTFSGDDLELLKAIANEIAVGINNLMLLERTKDLSVTDELTGLYNRRHFFEMLDVEMNRADRTSRPFSLVMLDLDRFKEYNDKYGHTNGDAALQAFSQMLKASMRKSDLAFRYGGDEFALILPIADAAKAKKIMQRARAKWQKAPLAQSRIFGGHVGFSTGIAEYPENAESADGIIFLADAALYQAKRKGGHEDKLVSELRTLSTDIMDVATQDQVYALAATVDSRDPYTYGHSQRVAEIAKLIGRSIGMADEDLAKLHAAALLHDVGKVGVPDAILTKMGEPTEEERRVIKRHSAEGARIVSYVKELASLVPIILHHHEWYDGTGYPDGLKGIDIPAGARITSIADAYDTMVTKRPYRNVVSPKEACEELRRYAGTQFDPALVEVWCKLVGEA